MNSNKLNSYGNNEIFNLQNWLLVIFHVFSETYIFLETKLMILDGNEPGMRRKNWNRTQIAGFVYLHLHFIKLTAEIVEIWTMRDRGDRSARGDLDNAWSWRFGQCVIVETDPLTEPNERTRVKSNESCTHRSTGLTQLGGKCDWAKTTSSYRQTWDERRRPY